MAGGRRVFLCPLAQLEMRYRYECRPGEGSGGQRVGELTKISACYSRGEISYSKVRAMTRVATVDNEDYLLMIAQHGTAYHMETLVRKYRRVMRLQEDGEQQHNERSLRVCLEADGTIVLHARLPAEKGALVLKAIEMAMDRDTQEEQDVSAETFSGGDTPGQMRPRKDRSNSAGRMP